MADRPLENLLRKNLLWVDSLAGLAVGLGMLALSPWLSPLYGLPGSLYEVIALANTGYGVYSLSLAVRQTRPRAGIVGLVVANGAWAVLCGVGVGVLWGVASPFGLAHILAEGVFVGGLAVLEWANRDRLLSAS